MKTVPKALKDRGLSTMVRWNYIFSCPPLIVTEEQLQAGLAILDEVLTTIDGFYEE